MKIILGSQSAGRQEMMQEMGLKFETMAAGIDEKAIRFSDPKKLTLALAHAKADALLKNIHEPSLLITSDQVVWWNGKILEKPETPEEARKFMQGYGEAPLETVTAVVVTRTDTNERQEGVDVATVWLKPFPEHVIEQFIQEGQVFSWAGGFGIQAAYTHGLVEKLEGSADSVMGLPKELTMKLLQSFSI